MSNVFTPHDQRNDTGYLRALAARGLCKIEMIVSIDVAKRIALNTEKIQGSLRDLSVVATLAIGQLGVQRITFSNDELVSALERAARISRRFDKEGNLTVSFAGDADAEGDTDGSEAIDVEGGSADPPADSGGAGGALVDDPGSTPGALGHDAAVDEPGAGA